MVILPVIRYTSHIWGSLFTSDMPFKFNGENEVNGMTHDVLLSMNSGDF